jgi:hypothetical protein
LLLDEPAVRLSLSALKSLLATGASHTAPRIRAGITRALADVTAGDPTLLTVPSVASVIASMLRDASKAVRVEALEIVGRYVTGGYAAAVAAKVSGVGAAGSAAPGSGGSSAPAAGLPARFWDLLVGKLGDESVAARKKAVSILRELLVSIASRGGVVALCASESDGADPATTVPFTSPVILPAARAGHVTRALFALLRIAASEAEESPVRDAARGVFDAIWFSPPARAALTVSAGGLEGRALRRAARAHVAAPRSR